MVRRTRTCWTVCIRAGREPMPMVRGGLRVEDGEEGALRLVRMRQATACVS